MIQGEGSTGWVHLLSDRERAVLSGLAAGLVCKQVADELDISLHTVRTYVRRIYAKLGVATLAEAVCVATRAERRGTAGDW